MDEPDTDPTLSVPIERGSMILVWGERIVFFAVGALLLVAALALVAQSVRFLLPMVMGGSDPSTDYGISFLDFVLLSLIFVELAYTVILSFRGAALSAEPFLIVGLIAVIRRMLVITAGDHGVKGALSVQETMNEVVVLTGVVIAFVLSIVALRSREPKGSKRGGT